MSIVRKAALYLAKYLPRYRLSTMADTIDIKLFEIIFPGEAYSPHRRPELAARLRHIAASLEQDYPQPQPQPHPHHQHKDLDFSLYQTRHVALEIMYVGHDLQGLARQTNTDNTVEEYLFTAMRKTRMIPSNMTWQELKYSRGGRTDKGVSALGNVIALNLRSAAKVGEPPIPEDEEFDYPARINKALPLTIRVLGWKTVPEDFSARFSARFREYKYFIVDTDGTLDVEAMRTAANYFIGEQDFRNFCKPDVTAVKSFVRKILDIKLDEVPYLSPVTGRRRRVLALYIRGTAFLWHQVRCMSAILMMVGRGDEEAEIVRTLLDVQQTPRRPMYELASEEPLLMYSCSYHDLSFRRSAAAHIDVLEGLNATITSHLTRVSILDAIEQRAIADGAIDEGSIRGGGEKRQRGVVLHVPLMKRVMSATIEEMKERKSDLIAVKSEKYPSFAK